jgi:hypothetical protein
MSIAADTTSRSSPSQAPAPSAQAAASSLASSAAFGTFAVVFAIAAPVLYVLSELGNLPLFTFHPGTNRFDFGWAPPRPNEGPAMYWYGWVATTLIGACVLGTLSMLIPQHVARKIPLFLVWLLPILAIPVLAYVLMPFWTR